MLLSRVVTGTRRPPPHHPRTEGSRRSVGGSKVAPRGERVGDSAGSSRHPRRRPLLRVVRAGESLTGRPSVRRVRVVCRDASSGRARAASRTGRPPPARNAERNARAHPGTGGPPLPRPSGIRRCESVTNTPTFRRFFFFFSVKSDGKPPHVS